ncbi:TorD/DmsD family molecular chaperone [Oceanicella actignis]|uniref:TorD/DmsD family molecular chaperone n=1 Tax=Oceanicella actignis TaxID=1189325 RepID=UPI0011E8760B|nr:molecular chaperone TorD family protein [Oceanicella actignis]TYO90470.1 TorA maturation chaperone TorD [Oceanicella actignis]
MSTSGQTAQTPHAPAPEDLLRADLYGFLAALLARPPSRDLLDRAAGLEGDDTPVGRAVTALARLARAATETSARREFDALFIGVGRGELLPYGSYYMTGFLNEKPLARLRADMTRLGIARAEGVFEPEDNIASLCEMMAGLIRGAYGAPADLRTQRDFFNAHLAPWAEHFFTDLEGAESSALYAPVGLLGRTFMQIEREAFRLEG